MNNATTLTFHKTVEGARLMAAFLAEMQKHGGEVHIEDSDPELWRVHLLGL